MIYRVTKIEPQKKDATRSSVFINGQFEFGATTRAIEKYGLVEGMALEEDAYQKMLEHIQLEKAKYRALDYLARGIKTEKQVQDKLVDWEYSLSIVRKVMCFLKEYRYVDDEAYTTQYTRSKLTYGKKSLRQIQSLLYAKGIKQCEWGIEEEVLETLEMENVRYFLHKYGYTAEIEREKKQKIIGKIMGRGFKYKLIEGAMRNIDETAME